MSQTQEIVILGAGYAGLIAASRLAKRTGRLQTHITLVNASEHFVPRIRLHQIMVGQAIQQRSIPRMLRNTPVAFVQGRVSAIQTTTKQIVVETSAETRLLRYDTLIYALGSCTDRKTVPGVSEYTMSLDGMMIPALCEKLAQLAQQGGGVVTIVGGGLTGLEAATEIAETHPHMKVELVFAQPLSLAFSQDGERYLRQRLQALSIHVRENVIVRQVEGGRLVLRDGRLLPFDLCIWAAGFTVPQIAENAGLLVNHCGQIITDEMLRSVSHPDIYAVGDAAAFQCENGEPLRMSCATALPMGAHAADAIAATLHGRAVAPFRFGFVARCVSLGRSAGLVQFTHPDDSPRSAVLTGFAGRITKELICRAVDYTLVMESHVGPVYRWYRPQVKSKDTRYANA